jgi:hypothetical protein
MVSPRTGVNCSAASLDGRTLANVLVPAQSIRRNSIVKWDIRLAGCYLPRFHKGRYINVYPRFNRTAGGKTADIHLRNIHPARVYSNYRE